MPRTRRKTLYKVSINHLEAIVSAHSPKQALNELVQEYAESIVITRATKEDIQWCQDMGAYIPKGVYAPDPKPQGRTQCIPTS